MNGINKTYLPSYNGYTIVTIMRAVIEKEIAFIMQEIVILDA